MDTSKIIKGVVGGGRYTTTAPIIKEDYGLYLKIEGLNLPSTYEVDFSNDEFNGSAVTMIGNADGVLIPHQFIDTGKDVFAFLYHVGEDFGRTIYKFKIPNKVRPDRTDETPTPEEQSVIDQAISALNDAVAQTAQDVIDANASAQSASDDADRAEQARDTAEGFASVASTNASESAQSAVNALTSARMAEDAKTSAQASASASAQSASASAQSAFQAQGYAQSASASAQSASSYASSAQTSANTASTKASEASASADLASRKASEITGLTAQANTLPSGSSATASYSNGTLTLGIPRGADGDDYTLTEQDKADIAELVDVPVDDVQINGTSIVQDGVANVPVASANDFGAVKAISSYGIRVDSSGVLRTSVANQNEIKQGTDYNKPITSNMQQALAFFGLAKASGDTTQSQSSNAVGVYTEEAKVAIQKMLGIYEAPWELINEETFTNETEADLVISTDSNGEAFELSAAFIVFFTPRQETVAKVGNYGQTIFGLSNGNMVFTESNAWENQANVTGKGFTAQAIIDGALIRSMSTQTASASSPGAWRSRWNIGNGNGFIDDVSITSVTIRAITGTAKYTLYGKRKWQ